MGEKDAAEKSLEAYNDVFADIVNNLLFDGELLMGEDELVDARERSYYDAKDKTIREQERDVSKLWVKKDKGITVRIAYLGLENETEPEEDMPFRVIAYDGAAYRDQIRYYVDKEGKRRKELERFPVITLVLYLGYKKRWDKAKSIYDVLGDKLDDRLKPFVQDHRINLFEIAWLRDEQVAGFKSDFRILADYLVQMRMNNDYIPSEIEMVHVREVLKMMTAVTGDDRFVESADRFSEDKREKTMCKFLDDAIEKGVRKAQQEIDALKAEKETWSAEKESLVSKNASLTSENKSLTSTIEMLQAKLAKYEPV